MVVQLPLPSPAILPLLLLSQAQQLLVYMPFFSSAIYLALGGDIMSHGFATTSTTTTAASIQQPISSSLSLLPSQWLLGGVVSYASWLTSSISFCLAYYMPLHLVLAVQLGMMSLPYSTEAILAIPLGMLLNITTDDDDDLAHYINMLKHDETPLYMHALIDLCCIFLKQAVKGSNAVVKIQGGIRGWQARLDRRRKKEQMRKIVTAIKYYVYRQRVEQQNEGR